LPYHYTSSSIEVSIKPNIWREAKIEAIRQNKTVSELVEEAVEAWIKAHALSELKAREVANKYAKSKV